MHRDSCGRRRCFEWPLACGCLFDRGPIISPTLTVLYSAQHAGQTFSPLRCCAAALRECTRGSLVAESVGWWASWCGEDSSTRRNLEPPWIEHPRNHDAMGKWICRCRGPRPARHLTRASRATPPTRATQANSPLDPSDLLTGRGCPGQQPSLGPVLCFAVWLAPAQDGPGLDFVLREGVSGLLVKRNDVARR